MVDHDHWQLDGSAPELYQRYLVPAITQKWADDLVRSVGAEKTKGRSVISDLSDPAGWQEWPGLRGESS
jgi:hypothetical protein